MLTCYRVLMIDQDSNIVIYGNFLLKMLNWPLQLETANHRITSSGGDLYLTSVGGWLVVFDQML